MVLALLGAALGAGLAALLSRGLVAFLTTEQNRMFVGLGIDWRVLGFTAATAVLTCVLFGLVPAIRRTGVAPAAVIRASGRGLTTGREKFSLRRILVVAQVAMSMVLLAGALLFVRSLQHSAGDRSGVSAGRHRPGFGGLSRGAFPERTHEPGAARHPRQSDPAHGSDRGGGRHGAGRRRLLGPECLGAGYGGPKLDVQFNHVGPGYFHTLGTTFVAGRDFNERDDLNSPQVAIVNEEFARKIFQGKNPVGRVFRREEFGNTPDVEFLVVGECGTRNITSCARISSRLDISPRPRCASRGGEGILCCARMPHWASSMSMPKRQ
jgi:putative ABC transport system permease protein